MKETPYLTTSKHAVEDVAKYFLPHKFFQKLSHWYNVANKRETRVKRIDHVNLSPM